MRSCLQPDGGFGNWPQATSYLECCFQAFVSLNTLDAIELFDTPAVRNFLLSRLCDNGGFSDDPGGFPTLFNTFYATVCMNMLEADERSLAKTDSFVELHRDSARGYSSFACIPGWRPEVIATFWAITAKYILGTISDNDRRQIAEFLDLCWDSSARAYGASPGHQAFVEYTFCALAIQILLEIEISTAKAEQVVQFVCSLIDSDSHLFGERPGAPGTLGDSMWATACLAMLDSTDALDLRAFTRTVANVQPSQLWHTHCRLSIFNHIDQYEPQTQPKIVNIDHIASVGGYTLVATKIYDRPTINLQPSRLDVGRATLASVEQLLNTLEFVLRTRSPDRSDKLGSTLKNLSLEVSTFLPREFVVNQLGDEHSFLELGCEPEMLTIPLELASIDGIPICLHCAVGRLPRTGTTGPAEGSSRFTRQLSVLLLGGSHRGQREVLRGVTGELDAIERRLRDVPQLRTVRLEGRELTRQALRNLLSREDTRWDIIHFSGHTLSYMINGKVSSVGLVLLDTEIEAGTMVEWLGGRMPRLVFINGCYSSKTQNQEIGLFRTANSGMASIWTTRGTPYLGSYWSIRDGESSHFGQAFYGFLASGMPLGEAVRLARLHVRNRGAGVCSWAGYSLVGNPRSRLARYRFSPRRSQG